MSPIPAARSLEDQILHQEDDIINAAIQTVDRGMI
jgi:hypothetical protein